MKQVFALLVYPKRQILVRQGISIALVYVFLLPYQMHYLQTWGEMTASREIFKTDQMFLPLLLLWSLFQFFLPVYQSGTKEVLQSLRHPVTSAAVLLMLLQQVMYVPLYIWTYVSLPHFSYISGILVFQLVSTAILFAAALELFASPVINMGVGIAYIGLSAPMAESFIPLLFRPNRMLDGFTLEYWVIYGGILCLLVVFLAVKYQLGKPKQAI